MASSIFIRPERPEDHPAVFDVNLRAFQRTDEARLVELLRPVARPLVSLVALEERVVVGHALFSPVSVDGSRGIAMGLGPLAVHPSHQRKGIGARLIQVGLDACRIGAVDWIFVLGDPRYYRRFGFRPARDHGLSYSREDLSGYLLVRELRKSELPIGGTVRYRPEFDRV